MLLLYDHKTAAFTPSQCKRVKIFHLTEGRVLCSTTEGATACTLYDLPHAWTTENKVEISFLALEPAQVLDNVVCMMRELAAFPTKTHADARVRAKFNSDTQHNHGLRRSILSAFHVGAINTTGRRAPAMQYVGHPQKRFSSPPYLSARPCVAGCDAILGSLHMQSMI